MIENNEIWKYIDNFDVSVSNLGRAKRNNKLIKGLSTRKNNKTVNLSLLITEAFHRKLGIDETIHFLDVNKKNIKADNMCIIHTCTKKSLKVGKYTGVYQLKNGKYGAVIKHNGLIRQLCHYYSFDICAMTFKRFVLNNDVNINYMHLVDDYKYNEPDSNGEIWKYWQDDISVSNMGRVTNWCKGRDSDYFGMKDSLGSEYILDLDGCRHNIKDLVYCLFNETDIPEGQIVVNVKGDSNCLTNLEMISKITKRWLKHPSKRECTGVYRYADGWYYSVSEENWNSRNTAKSEIEAAVKFKQWVIDNNINTNLMNLIEGRL